MLCENCKKKEATIFLKAIINGKIKFLNLCDECAKSKGYSYEMPKSSALDYAQNIIDYLVDDSKKRLKCNFCGLSYSEFKTKGLLSCPLCYISFKKQLKNVFLNLKRERYEGEKYKINLKVYKKEVEKKEISQLKKKLKICLDLQDYKIAKKIGKKIKELENEK